MKILDFEQLHITIVALQKARFSGPGKIWDKYGWGLSGV